MDFLTRDFDLTQTIYKDSDLRLARAYLETWIKREKASWLKNPQGPYGKYWKEDSAISACNLINLSHMMDTITRRITSESVPRLYKKVKDNLLPNPKDIKQFHETLAELQVAFELITYLSPLVIEPPIHGQSRSPDFAFQLPEGMNYMDVTVFRGGPLEKWEDTKEQIRQAIHRRVIKRKEFLNIDIRIGLEPIKPDQVIRQVLDAINDSPTGKIPVGNKGLIQWEPCPIIEVEEGSSISDIPSSSFAGVIRSPGVTINDVVATQATLVLPTLEDIQKINELVFNAIRNKLKSKHDQFPPNQPAFYVIKLGHHRITNEDMLRILREHIWKKDDYRWISGIIIFTPQQGFLATDKKADLTLSTNPRSKFPASDSLLSIFTQGTQFHY